MAPEYVPQLLHELGVARTRNGDAAALSAVPGSASLTGNRDMVATG
jgi:hypothetical protein